MAAGDTAVEFQIDDFSDYEEEESNAKARSSVMALHHGNLDWSLLPQPKAQQQAFDIDDLSDYEDDTQAQRSSLLELDACDWTAAGTGEAADDDLSDAESDRALDTLATTPEAPSSAAAAVDSEAADEPSDAESARALDTLATTPEVPCSAAAAVDCEAEPAFSLEATATCAELPSSEVEPTAALEAAAAAATTSELPSPETTPAAACVEDAAAAEGAEDRELLCSEVAPAATPCETEPDPPLQEAAREASELRCPEAPPSAAAETADAPLYAGALWLCRSGGWQQRWAVLRPAGLAFYSSEDCCERQGYVELTASSRATASARSDALLLDADPEAGDGRQLLHLDTGSPEACSAWAAAFAAAAGCAAGRLEQHGESFEIGGDEEASRVRSSVAAVHHTMDWTLVGQKAEAFDVGCEGEEEGREEGADQRSSLLSLDGKDWSLVVAGPGNIGELPLLEGAW